MTHLQARICHPLYRQSTPFTGLNRWHVHVAMDIREFRRKRTMASAWRVPLCYPGLTRWHCRIWTSYDVWTPRETCT